MALTKCTECGHDVSTRAQACPGCGTMMVAQKVESFGKRKVSWKGAFLILLLMSLVTGMMAEMFSRGSSSTTTAANAPPPKSCDRKAIDKTLDGVAQVWYKIRGETVMIREAWYGLPLDQKRALDVLMHCHIYGHQYHVDNLIGPIELILYKDFRSGKDVAKSSAWLGFQME